MPSVKIPRKSTDFDMTPFVDVAFLILTFFILATKFKPPEAVPINPPGSVSADALEEKDAVLVTLDSIGRVFFTLQTDKPEEDDLKRTVIENMNKTRGLGLTEAEMASFVKNSTIGVPISKVKSYLALSEDEQKSYRAEGIPIMDSASNELYYWVRDAVSAFAGRPLNYMVKGDSKAKYPAFKNVLSAFKRNEIFKFKLVTAAEDAPEGSELWKERNK